MKFVNIRYVGAATYRDRTALKNVWEPGDEKPVSEKDAHTLLGYLEFERAEAKPGKADATKADAKKGKTAGAEEKPTQEEAEKQAQQAQQEVLERERSAKKQAEAEMLEVELMNKGQLEAYARETYGVELDKRRSVDMLRTQVIQLAQGGQN